MTLSQGRHAAKEALGMRNVLVLRDVEAVLEVEDRAGAGLADDEHPPAHI
jgi:hypothetical protein